jgi:hypothetical protein
VQGVQWWGVVGWVRGCHHLYGLDDLCMVLNVCYSKTSI